MLEPAYLRHALRRVRSLVALTAIAWVPAAVLTLAIVVLGGAGALRSNVFMTVLASHAAIVVGHALAVPAMFRVLHRDQQWRTALGESARTLPLNAALALTVVPTSLLAVSLWPEIWGTVSEVLAIQMLAVAPIVLVCQLAWMQQVADGGDAPTVAYDTFYLVRHGLAQLALLLLPTYAIAYGIVAANLIPAITAPLAIAIVTIPFTAWTWHTWCHVTGARPAWETPTRTTDASETTDEHDQSQQRRAPILHGGGGPAKLTLATTSGIAAGAWLQLDPADTFTATIRVSDDSSRDWAAYLWRPGGQWRELEQLWNDGRHLIAHGTCWGERAYVAFARRDGTPGVPFTAWISVATQAATHQQQPPTETEHAAA